MTFTGHRRTRARFFFFSTTIKQPPCDPWLRHSSRSSSVCSRTGSWKLPPLLLSNKLQQRHGGSTYTHSHGQKQHFSVTFTIKVALHDKRKMISIGLCSTLGKKDSSPPSTASQYSCRLGTSSDWASKRVTLTNGLTEH